jgi:flagellar hook-associated protein 2
MAPITLSGFNNIDFRSIIDIIIQSERQPITRLEDSKKAEQSRLTAYGSLSSVLSRVQDAAAALESPSAFGNLKATSSDASVLSAEATSSATKGTLTIDVISLARPQVTVSAASQFSDINATIIDGGSFSITQGGVTTNIDLTGVNTLAQLRDAINAQQTGVKASIINDGSTVDSPPKPFRLVLTSTEPGAANAFTVSDATTYLGGAPGALNLSTDATNGVAQDTEFKYNGITIKSTSTTVSDAIPGLTLTLVKTGTARIAVTDDDTPLKDKLTELVDAFNSFDDFVQGQFKVPTSSGSTRAPLSTDPLLRSVNRQIRSYLTSNHSNSGDIENLVGLGIKLNQTGKLEIDTEALEDALANDPDGVEAFLSEALGFADKIGTAIDAITESIDAVEDRIEVTISNYTNRIATLESQLVIREDALVRMFAAADEAISQLNSQANALSALGSQYRLF